VPLNLQGVGRSLINTLGDDDTVVYDIPNVAGGYEARGSAASS
jgi:hypothetical protein